VLRDCPNKTWLRSSPGKKWDLLAGELPSAPSALFQLQEGHHVVHLALTRVEATLGMGLRAQATGPGPAERAARRSTSYASSLRDDLAVSHIPIVS